MIKSTGTNSLLFRLILIGLLHGQNLNAQGIGINASGTPPDSSAMLDISSTSKGFLFPRMSTAQRNSIALPAQGLQIFNLDTDCIEVYFAGGGWLPVRCGCLSFPDATFSAGAGYINAPLTFTANGTGPGYTYVWTFPSGTPSFSSAQQPGVVWDSAGTYLVSLTVTDNLGCSSTDTQSMNISACPPPGSQTFQATGQEQVFTVPACITQITIDAYGAQGEDPSFGGRGGRASGTLSVTPGQLLFIYVGQSGDNGGWNGGFSLNSDVLGGGASDVRIGSNTLQSRVIVAGGGGGRGLSTDGSGCTGNVLDFRGGDGGAATGQAAENTLNSSFGGQGGTQTAGGAGGSGGLNTGFSGTLGQGGAPGSSACGHGGGGYYGGGGGGSSSGCNRSGGGGGSNYTGGVTELINQRGVRTGDGMVIISW